MADPLAMQNAVVLFGIEAQANSERNDLSPLTDAILVEEPGYTTEATTIERNFSKADMSPFPFRMGRLLGQVTFGYEIRGNGKQKSGELADAPLLARLMQACGFELKAVSTAAERVGPVYPELSNIGVANWAVGGAPVNDEAGVFTLTCTTAGAAAAAKFTVTCNNPVLQAEPVTNVAANEAIALGDTGATVTPTIQGNLAVGDVFRVLVMPKGIAATPVSKGFKTATIEAYFDGLKHKLTGAVGTFSFSGESSGITKLEFTFSGVHKPVVDAPMPLDAVYDDIQPPLLEAALITWGSKADLAIGGISFDLAATNTTREDANAAEGYRGMQYTGRAPTGGFTPEATLEAENPFWADLRSAAQKFFFARVGTEPGNGFLIEGPRVQTSGLGYTDRNSNRAYEVSLKFARFKGNDEVRFLFC